MVTAFITSIPFDHNVEKKHDNDMVEVINTSGTDATVAKEGLHIDNAEGSQFLHREQI